MKFIYGNGVTMHVKIYKDVICVEILLPSDCLNINEFRAIHVCMNTHSDAHGYSLEHSYCLNFNSKNNFLV